jgi:hypothetical protein
VDCRLIGPAGTSTHPEFASTSRFARWKGSFWTSAHCAGTIAIALPNYPTPDAHRKNVDNGMLAESCYICLEGQTENGIQHSPRGLFDTTPLLQAARGGDERNTEEIWGVAFTAPGGPRLVRYLGLNLMFVPGGRRG